MVYLERFQLPDQNQEDSFLSEIRRTCYPTRYPFNVFRYRQIPEIRFGSITILYGGNGSGKSTMLNVIAEKLGVHRTTVYNRSPFFKDYVALCDYKVRDLRAVKDGRIITSDEVFDYLLNIRYLNENLDNQRETLLSEYKDARYSGFQMKSLEDYEQLKKHVDADRSSGSAYVKRNLMEAVPERSNGESALAYFTEVIGEHALYLLDEPENSLSPRNQLELRRFLEDSVRFFNCQFVISTHSPFLLSMAGAVVYDLDSTPPMERHWTQLENIQIYRDFFQSHEQEFGGYEND